MAIEWYDNAVDSIIRGWTNEQVDRVADIARRNIKDGSAIETVYATPFVASASIVGGEESLRSEYGDALTDPAPWGWPSIVQASIDG